MFFTVKLRMDEGSTRDLYSGRKPEHRTKLKVRNDGEYYFYVEINQNLYPLFLINPLLKNISQLLPFSAGRLRAGENCSSN